MRLHGSRERGRISAQPALLTRGELRTLEIICDTLLPALPPEDGDDAHLFSLSASSVGVAGAVQQALALLDGSQQRQFRLLLRALEQPATIRLLTGKSRRFTRLSQPDRERVLLALATHRLPLLRTGFQGLKRLAAFLFYSVTDERGDNPTWPGIGYVPSTAPPARGTPLQLTYITRPMTLECDVCVVGSGAGGSIVASELAAAGKRVVVLEGAGGQQAHDFSQRELPGMQQLYLDAGLTSSRDLGMAILAGASLGGGTTVNWQASLPLPRGIREEWEVLSGCSHFVDPSFDRSFDAVRARLNVGTDESIVNPNNAVLQRGCEALGYRWSILPRNSKGCDAAQCGYCVFGCRHGGKQSAAVTYLRDAQTHGDTTIIPNCRVERLLISNGRVAGVEALARGREENNGGSLHRLRVRAAKVVVTAGAINSPLLLMRSGVSLPALGRNLFLHPTSAVAGIYDEPIETWSGPPQTIMSDHFANLAGLYGFRFEAAPAHPGLLALAAPWHGAFDHRRTMQQFAHASALIVLTRDQIGGQVRPSRSGKPIITYYPDAQEISHLKRGIAEAARVHIAAGARDLITLHTRDLGLKMPKNGTPGAVDDYCRRLSEARLDRNWSTLFSAHQMGTCRMGSSPRRAVCGPDGQVFGVRGLFIADGSAFPASSGVNPMLTIMALAHHTAQQIKA